MTKWGLIPILFTIILLITPVNGQTVTEIAPEGHGIVNIMITSNPDTTGSISFSFNDGTTMTGAWSYKTTNGGLTRDAYISIGGESTSKVYVTPGIYRTGFFLPGNVNSLSNTSDSRVKVTGGQWDIPDLRTSAISSSSPVISLTFTTDNDVTYDVETLDMNIINKNTKGDLTIDLCPAGNDIWACNSMELAYNSFWDAYAFVQNLVYWLKFFFIDNLMLVITLYISVSMVFAARSARGRPDRFLSRFIGNQVKLYNFIIAIWRMLIESIGTIRGWFRI